MTVYDYTVPYADGKVLDLSSDIKWNFTKFLVDRQGQVVARFEPTENMDSVESAIMALL